MGKSVLMIGLEPSLIDFSEKHYSAHPGLNAEMVRAALERDKAVLGAIGFDTRLCMIDFGETAARVVKAQLKQKRFDCVLVGAGVRLNAQNTVVFETVINIVHEHAPQAKLCFNTRATDTAEAVQRWFPAG